MKKILHALLLLVLVATLAYSDDGTATVTCSAVEFTDSRGVAHGAIDLATCVAPDHQSAGLTGAAPYFVDAADGTSQMTLPEFFEAALVFRWIVYTNGGDCARTCTKKPGGAVDCGVGKVCVP
jgi:hypothetical protein